MNEPTKPGTPPSVEGIVTRPSPFSVQETLERLQEAIPNRNMILFAQTDHSGEAKRAGLTMQEAHVLIFGNPKGGTPLMIASPLLALDLSDAVVLLPLVGHDGVGSEAGEQGISVMGIGYLHIGSEGLTNGVSVPPATWLLSLTRRERDARSPSQHSL